MVKAKKCIECGALIRLDREACRKCGAIQPDDSVKQGMEKYYEKITGKEPLHKVEPHQSTVTVEKSQISSTDEMSDSELLRKIAKHSEESAFVLKRFLFVAQVFAVIWFIGMIIQFIQAAN